MVFLWKTVKEVPKGGISIKGNPNAWPKWNPLWRFQHKWNIFEVDSGGKPYYVYFYDGVVSMYYCKLITTECFVARIGARNLCFAAVLSSDEDMSLPIIQIGANNLGCATMKRFLKVLPSITMI